jgi:hypothetical protein
MDLPQVTTLLKDLGIPRDLSRSSSAGEGSI